MATVTGLPSTALTNAAAAPGSSPGTTPIAAAAPTLAGPTPRLIDPPTGTTPTGTTGLRLPPPITVRTSAATAPGLVFSGARTAEDNSRQGMVYDNTGRLLYADQMRCSPDTPVTYLGKPAVARDICGWWNFQDADGKVLASVYAPNGGHQRGIVRTNAAGTRALVLSVYSTRADLSPYGGPVDGRVLSTDIYETDLTTGQKTFSWSSLGGDGPAIPLSDSLVDPVANPDYAGIDAADWDTDGNLLVSATNTGAVYKIDKTNRTIGWILGGKRNQFTFVGDPGIGRPIDARLDAAGRLSLLDDNSAPKSARSVTYDLDTEARTATLAASWAPNPPVYDVRTGGNQLLPNGNRLLTFGAQGSVVEVDAAGAVVFESRLPSGYLATPATRAERSLPGVGAPVVVRGPRDSGAKFPLTVSWNGATELASWQVSAGPDADHLRPVATAAVSTLETSVEVPVEPGDTVFTVTALDADGNPLAGGTTSPAYVDSLAERYATVAADAAQLGTPLSVPYRDGALWVRDYANGKLMSATLSGGRSYLLQKPIADVYAAKGKSLGAPTGDTLVTGDTRIQWFEYGAIVFSPATGGRVVSGGIVTEWARVGQASGVLGLPTTDELSTPDGIGRYQHFQYGSVYWTARTGAHEIHGANRDKWIEQGWERGPLGYPTTGETLDREQVGRFNDFQGGQIIWTPQTWSHVLRGAILQGWVWQQRGVLGYPITDELGAPDGIGRYTHFQYGSMYWTPQTGAAEVHGAIRDLWAKQGWERGPLGYPARSEQVMPDYVGRAGQFQNGYILWSPATGAHALPTAFDNWPWPGGQNSMGYPTMDVRATPDGKARYVLFEYGGMYTSPSFPDHAFPIRGAFWLKYKALGYERGCLGYPMTAEFTETPGKVVQYFGGGMMAWTAATGTAVAYCNGRTY